MEFLSPEWLEASLTAAEMMPDDHRITLSEKVWFAVLLEGAEERDVEVQAVTWFKVLREIKAKRDKKEGL